MKTLINLMDRNGVKFSFVLDNIKRFQPNENNDLIVIELDNEVITLDLDYDEGMKIVEEQNNRQ